MTNPTNWPNPERPGFPMFPERDGWHWVATQGNALRPLYWCWKSESWCASADPWANFWKYTDSWSYIGPCLTPAQIAELLAAEREKCAQEAIHIGESWNGTALSPCNTARHIVQAIRNLGAAP